MLEPFSFDPSLLGAFTRQLPGYEWFFYAVTQAGSSLTLTFLASLAFLLGKNRLKIFAAILLIGMLLSTLVVGDLKDIFERPRPQNTGLTAYPTPESYSFPSGHAFTIFLAVSILGAYYGWKYYAAGYVIALAVALSRLFLGVHYPSDVLAGALLGMILGELLIYAAYRYGLCDNFGLVSYLIKPVDAGIVHAGTERVLSVIVFLALPSAALAYNLDYAALAISILALAALLIVFYATASGLKYDPGLLMAFVLAAIGLISALSLLLLGAYGLSLIITALTYIILLALTVYRRPLPTVN